MKKHYNLAQPGGYCAIHGIDEYILRFPLSDWACVWPKGQQKIRLTPSFYAMHLIHWLTVVPKEQILIVQHRHFVNSVTELMLFPQRKSKIHFSFSLFEIFKYI